MSPDAVKLFRRITRLEAARYMKKAAKSLYIMQAFVMLLVLIFLVGLAFA